LLQGDVDVALVAELSKDIKKRVLGEKPPAGMTIKEHFVKILYDEFVKFLGREKGEIALKKQRILVIGLFGSGKTTTIGKIGKWFKTRGLTPAFVACDTHRPAAQEQLKQLAEKIGVNVYSQGEKPEDIAKNALKAKEDILIFDSAGRDALDQELAKELKAMGEIIKPDEVLLVIPADIGQAARKQAEEFNKLVGITGIVVTKLDGTAKGGGALVASAVSGAKIKFIGIGEKIDDLEAYDPQRFCSRLIGYGDIQGLLEKAKAAGVDEKSAKRMMEGKFTLLDFHEQIKSMQGMGSLSKVMEMVPGASGMKIPKDFLDIQEGKMKKWKFAIDSMTPEERENPDVIKIARVKRIAKGAGVTESDIRSLLKHFKQTKKIMKMTGGGKGLKRGPLSKLVKQFGLKV
jgi:signal recognition particle subunit SRP54